MSMYATRWKYQGCNSGLSLKCSQTSGNMRALYGGLLIISEWLAILIVKIFSCRNTQVHTTDGIIV